MVLAIVPDAPPARKNHRATSWPAPISAKAPYVVGSRLIRSAFWCVSGAPSVPPAGSTRLSRAVVTPGVFAGEAARARGRALPESRWPATSAQQLALLWRARQEIRRLSLAARLPLFL